MKSGFIGIIGRPNVGKSTLMNAMLEEKIAITSAKPQTTLNRIKGIYTDMEYDGGDFKMNRGDKYFIPAQTKITLKNAEALICYPPKNK